MMKGGVKNSQELDTASSKIQQKIGEKLISALPISGKMSVLDIGSGDGALTLKLAKRTEGPVVGIDRSPENLLFSKKQAENKSISNAIFVEMDPRTMKFDTQFDVIFSNSRLHLVNGHDHVLRSIKNALKPDGIIGLQFPLVTKATPFIEAIEKVIKSQDMQGYYSNWTPSWFLPGPEGYGSMLKQAGINAESRTISDTINFSTLEESMQFFNYNILNEYLRLLPESEKPMLVNHVTRNLEEQLKSGEISFQMERLFVLSNPEKFDLLAESIRKR